MKTYQLSQSIEKRLLFKDLTVNFSAKRLTGIIGPNGSGKSTLLRILAAIDKPNAGKITLQKQDLHEISPRQRAQEIAYLPQQNLLHHDLTALEIVLLGRAPYQKLFSLWSKQDYDIAHNCLQRVGLENEAERYISTLSGGELQRVMLARLLATEANILLLDEPITALDINHSLSFLNLCQELCRNDKTIILVLHQLELAFRYCDDILLLGYPHENLFQFGTTKKVMTAKNLGETFQVKVGITSSNLIFS